MEITPLDWPDYLAIVLYVVLILGVGFWGTCRAKRDDTQGYFLAGRSVTWIPLGASTWATNVGAPMFVGMAGSAAASGVAVVMFEWHAMLMLILLGWLFLPVYMSSGCTTMPEYLKLRFGGQRIRIWLAIVHTLLTIMSNIAGQMYAGALFMTEIFEWDLYLSVALILGLTAIYTIMGGLTAVIWTDTIQTAILVVGASILVSISLIAIGGWENVKVLYKQSSANYTSLDVSLYGNRTCGLPRTDAFHIFRSPTADYPWPGMIFGLTILGLNCWCTDQTVVQRSLAAKNMTHAKGGLLLAAYLKALSVFFFVIPGMISRIYFPEEVACADPDLCNEICSNPSGCSNLAYPLLVIRKLPKGVKGIMLAALLAALMSSLTSVFNSSSTIFTMDIWRRLRRRAKESELMVVGRVYTLFLVAVSILWLPILEKIQGSQFWHYSQAIGSYLIPPIVSTFLLGLLWTRTTEKGAFAGLVVGLIVGIIRMGLTWARSPPQCGSGLPDTQFAIVSQVHYFHFAMILAAISAIVAVAVSVVTEPRPPRKLHRVTFWTRTDPDLPDFTESESETSDHEDMDDEPPADSEQTKESALSRIRYLSLKWFCGVDKKARVKKLTKDQLKQQILANTNITEDPFWKKVTDINALICAGVCVFIHGYWA